MNRSSCLAVCLTAITIATSALAAPGPVTLVSPKDAVATSHTPTFRWTGANPAATWYYVWLNRNGQTYRAIWVEGTANTSAVLDVALPSGQYEWWVRTWNASGYGPWSASAKFSVNDKLTIRPVVFASAGVEVGDLRPSAMWLEEDIAPFPPRTARWYLVWIGRDGDEYHREWVERTTWEATWDFPDGNYEFWVLGWSEDGYGSWARLNTFTVSAAKPGAATLLAPSVNPDRTATFYVNNSTPIATWYYLWIEKNGSLFFRQWLKVEEFPWTYPSLLPAGNYTYWIQTWNSSGYGAWSAPWQFQI